MRSLRAGNLLEVDLPFTEASDVYAFGSVVANARFLLEIQLYDLFMTSRLYMISI